MSRPSLPPVDGEWMSGRPYHHYFYFILCMIFVPWGGGEAGYAEVRVMSARAVVFTSLGVYMCGSGKYKQKRASASKGESTKLSQRVAWPLVAIVLFFTFEKVNVQTDLPAVAPYNCHLPRQGQSSVSVTHQPQWVNNMCSRNEAA